MKSKILRFLLLLGFFLTPAGYSKLPAEEQAPHKPQAELQDSEQAEQETQLRRRRRGRTFFPSVAEPDSYQRNHSSVKSAFRSIVSEPTKSTVIVLAEDKQVGLGTVVASGGYVLTKYSELKDNLMCKFADGKKMHAEVVGVHDETDLALLKVEVDNLLPIQWRNSEPPAVGEWLATTGLEVDPLSIGVVSVGPRRIAAPSGILGILIEQAENGPRIDQVLPDSGAEEAGLQVNDIILSVNGELMKTRDQLIETVKKFRPGAGIRINVLRGDETLSMTATLGDRTGIDPGGRRQNFQNTLGGGLSDRRAGFPSVLQHDTVLRPRECGGPIVDVDGNAVGINIARAGRVASFALPVSVIKPLLPDFLAGKFSPEVAAQNRLEELTSKIARLRAAEEALAKKVADFEAALKRAQEAEAAAQTASGNAEAKLKRAKQATAEAEQVVERAKMELKVAQNELKSVETEKMALQQGLAEKQ